MTLAKTLGTVALGLLSLGTFSNVAATEASAPLLDKVPPGTVLTIGDLGPTLARMIRDAVDRKAELCECGDLAGAVEEARKLGQNGDVVLLSPGCASFGQFRNFEERGQQFTKLARVS